MQVKYAVVAALVLSGCGGGDASGGDCESHVSNKESSVSQYCVDDADCGGLLGDCLYEGCTDHQCEVVDLADPSTPLPVDPDSGLPVGKGCKN